MKTKSRKRAYVKPECVTITVENFGNLMDTSMPGQHNPAQPGTGPTPNPAKQGWIEEEEFEEEENWGANW